MANQYTEAPPERAIAVKLLSRGECTVGEIASHFGMHRQTIQNWAKIAGIDAVEARAKWIRRAIERAGGG